jgi:lipid A 3-O-deacylase
MARLLEYALARAVIACQPGENVSLWRSASRAGTGILVVLGIATVHPAAAQIVFGSPADSPRIAIGGGAFDVVPNSSSNKPGVGPTGLALGEYRFGDVLWMVAPFVGAFGTGKGAFYGYGGFGFDINFTERFVLTPTAAVGYFTHGSGIDLGAHTEFRLGAELDYRFENLSRLGIGFYHMSNAGIGQHDPGAELVTVVLTMPFH